MWVEELYQHGRSQKTAEETVQDAWQRGALAAVVRTGRGGLGAWIPALTLTPLASEATQESCRIHHRLRREGRPVSVSTTGEGPR